MQSADPNAPCVVQHFVQLLYLRKVPSNSPSQYVILNETKLQRRFYCSFHIFLLLLFYRSYSLLVSNPHWNFALKCQQQNNGLSLLPVWPLQAPPAETAYCYPCRGQPACLSACLPTLAPQINLRALACTVYLRVPLIRETSRQTWQIERRADLFRASGKSCMILGCTVLWTSISLWASLAARIPVGICSF